MTTLVHCLGTKSRINDEKTYVKAKCLSQSNVLENVRNKRMGIRGEPIFLGAYAPQDSTKLQTHRQIYT